MSQIKVSGGMILLARKRRMMTQTALASATGLPQTHISRMENSDVQSVDSSAVQSLSEALNFPRSFFSPHGDDLFRQPLSLHPTAFRKAASSSKKKVDFAVSVANHYALQIRKLLDPIDFDRQIELPKFEIIDDNSGLLSQHAASVSSAEEAARFLRQIWQLPCGPIGNLTALVEASGIIVVHADFEDVDVDGITLRPIGLAPIIFINRNRPECRKRFSLAHELGHVVLHYFESPKMEVEANEFAAELLMPRADIFPDFRRGLSLPRLGALKLKWKSAMSSILYMAGEINAISDYESTRLWKKLSAAGLRKREPIEFDVPPEEPTVFRRLIEMHLTDLGYSTAELAQMLDTEFEEFMSMAALSPESSSPKKKHTLRVVVDNSGDGNRMHQST